jgi:drug/metabolite transporter (DMT)-like permease
VKIFAYTAFALVAFAFNSILCRLALGREAIDAASFTTVRLVSGALTLTAISWVFNRRASIRESGSWLSAFFLFAYAICFSLAYLDLTAATGALILFGAVQLTMIGVALVRGERPKPLEWLGLILAFAGLVYLVFPGLSAPPPVSSMLMLIAGIAWGFYTLRGKGSDNPLADTTGNFIRTVPMTVVALLPFFSQIQASHEGVILAILSGAITSGIGYSVWYAALKHHTATRAAALQLSVPAITAISGVIVLAEELSLRLVLASCLILGGIGLVILGRQKIKKS